MKIKTTYLILIILISINRLHAQSNNEQDQDVIEIEFNKCLNDEGNMTTAGMVGCVFIAKQEWDKELNKYYLLCMEEFSKNEKKALQKSQRSWIKFRDNELVFSALFYGNMQGTLYRISNAMLSKRLTQERALLIKMIYNERHYDE